MSWSRLSSQWCGRMIRVRSPRAGIPGVLLVLALAGLVVMHGLDAGAVAHAGVEASTPSTAGRGMQSGSVETERSMAVAGSSRSGQPAHGDAGRTAETGPEGRAAHVGWGHIVAACVAVLATCATGAIRRLPASPGARICRGRAPVTGGSAHRPAVVRPPGPARVELCVLTC
ncbi:MAG TPA: hypothetical protein VFZ79_03430 [Acidimicrobiales bacterium]